MPSICEKSGRSGSLRLMSNARMPFSPSHENDCGLNPGPPGPLLSRQANRAMSEGKNDSPRSVVMVILASSVFPPLPWATTRGTLRKRM